MALFGHRLGQAAGVCLSTAALIAAAVAISRQPARIYEVSAKDQGHLVASQYPVNDFQIELRVVLKSPGSILDTVGIDAAPTGSWSIAAAADYTIQFNLWDGSKWTSLSAPAKLVPGEEGFITLRRSGGRATLRVGGSWGRMEMPTPLSGKPVYAGDYPPDAHWGSGYNIHQAALGAIEVLYVGQTRIAPAIPSDYSSRIVDLSGSLSAGDRQALAAALRTYQERKGVAAAAVFMPDGDQGRAQAALANTAHQLIAQGLLPESYCAFLTLPGGHRMYHRSTDVDKLVSWGAIQPVWDKHAAERPGPEALAAALLELSGAGVPAPSSKPPQPGRAPGGGGQASGPVSGPVSGPATGAKGRIEAGPEGGQGRLAGVEVVVPAGALSEPNALIVQGGAPTPFGVPGVSIEFEKGEPVLSKPATIVFPIPAGADPSKLAALRSLDDRVWVTMPLSIDKARGVAEASTNHFCKTVLLDTGRTTVQISSSVGTLVGGTLVLAYIGAAPVTTTASAITAATFLAIGWLGGGAAYSSAQKEGLIGPYAGNGFSIYWDPASTPSAPFIVALIDKRDGALITWTKDSRDNRPPSIGPAGEKPRTTLTYTRNGRQIEVPMSELVERRVPVCIPSLAYDLEVARAFYQSLGVPTPDDTTVYVYDRVGRSPDNEKAINSGLWDGKVLGINSKTLKADPPSSQETRAASAHEYWHAVSSHNSFLGAWLGMEEAVAVGLESLVWSSHEGADPGSLMADFANLHAWHSCSPVFRSGILSIAEGESADSQGYKQWPLVKHIFHKEGKAALADLVAGRFSKERLGKSLESFALSAFISDGSIKDPARLESHPVFGPSITRTGWAGHVLVQDEKARTIKMGASTARKSQPGSINAFVVDVPARSDATPPCPIVARRDRIGSEHQPAKEAYFAGRPMLAKIAQPKAEDVIRSEGAIALPESWDSGAGQLPLMIVASVEASGRSSIGAAVVDPSMDPYNPILAYRLAPPTGVKFQHLGSAADSESKTLFTWGLPELGGGLKPAAVLGGYRIYGRKAKGAPVLVAELAIRKENAGSGWRRPADPAAEIDSTTEAIELPIARSKVLEFDEFAMSSLDGTVVVGGKPLEGPAGWQGASDAWAALAQCTEVNLQAVLAITTTLTSAQGDQPPVVQTTSYPVAGNTVNPPDVWGFGSGILKGGKFSSQQGRFEYKWTGQLGGKNAVSAGSLMYALNAYNPEWPFNSGSAFDGPTTVTLRGSIDRQGRLLEAVYSVEHAQFGCTLTIRDMTPAAMKLDGSSLEFTYAAKEQEATAKTSGHRAWMKWTYTNGHAELVMSEYRSTRGIRLTISRHKRT